MTEGWCIQPFTELPDPQPVPTYEIDLDLPPIARCMLSEERVRRQVRWSRTKELHRGKDLLELYIQENHGRVN